MSEVPELAAAAEDYGLKRRGAPAKHANTADAELAKAKGGGGEPGVGWGGGACRQAGAVSQGEVGGPPCVPRAAARPPTHLCLCIT